MKHGKNIITMFRKTIVRTFRPSNNSTRVETPLGSLTGLRPSLLDVHRTSNFTGIRPLRSEKMGDFQPKNIPNTNQSTCNYKPHVETESVEVFYKYSGILLILGGIAGAGKFGSDTYKRTKHDGYFRCVGETTVGGFTGFAVGMAVMFMSPILVPMGTLVAVVRYFDTEKP